MHPKPLTALRALAMAPILLAMGCASLTGPDDTEPTAARVTITGVITFADNGDPWLVTCGAGSQRVRVGTMTKGNYLYLRRRVRDLEGRETQPVTAQMSGYLRRAKKTRLMEQPALMWLSAGHCTDPDEPPMDRHERRRRG